MAVYDKNTSGAGNNPDDNLENMLEAGQQVDHSDEDAATKAAQRRVAARERLEAKLEADAAAERARRRRIAIIIAAIIGVIVLIAGIVVGVRSYQDKRARAAAAEAARWADCQWFPDQPINNLVEQTEKAVKELRDQLADAEKQAADDPEAKEMFERQRKDYESELKRREVALAWAPTAQTALDTQKRTVKPPANGTYPRTGMVHTTLDTSMGTLHIKLINNYAPCNNAAFQKMIKEKYFDDTTCHRLTSSDELRVLQCGDPTATGMGGPGFYSPDEIPQHLIAASGQNEQGAQAIVTYPKGTVAVAKSQQPNSGGSQIFIALADSKLPAGYSVIGQVEISDFPILDRIRTVEITEAPGQLAPEGEKLTDGTPTTPIAIKSWRIVSVDGVVTKKAK